MCCKPTLQQRAKTAGIVDVILAVLSIITGGIDIRQLLKDREADNEEDKNAANSALILVYIVLSISVTKLIMGFLLWQGANERNYKKCKIWLIVSLILWIIHLTDFITKLAIGTLLIGTTISNSLAIVIRVLVMYFVFSFIKEIRNGGPMSKNENANDQML